MPWNGYDDWFAKIQREKMYFSDPDLMYAQQDPNFAHAMYQYKTDYNNATTPEGKALANANAEKLRSGYSYRGGSAGDRYDPFGGSNQIPFTGTTDNWAGRMQGAAGRIFSYPDWQHSQGYNKALDNVLGYGPFEYDYSTDPLYSVYKKEYTREGQRAQQDALAQAAVMTGGVPSSYAQTAAQQAGNYYASQLADKIPELRAQAYGEYNQNLQNLLSQYDAAYRGDAFDYGVYGDNYQRLLDQFGLASGRYDTELGQADAAAAQLAALGDYTGYDNLYGGGYQAAYDAQRAREEALEAAQLAAKNGNYTLLEQYYGVPTGTFAKQYRGGPGVVPGGADLANGLPIPKDVWQQIYDASLDNPSAARQYINQYWSGLSESQRNILARFGGVTPEDLVQRGGSTQIGQSTFANYADMLADYESSQAETKALNNAWNDAVDWYNAHGADSMEDYFAEHYKELGYDKPGDVTGPWNNLLRSQGIEPNTSTKVSYTDAFSSQNIDPRFLAGGRGSEEVKQMLLDAGVPKEEADAGVAYYNSEYGWKDSNLSSDVLNFALNAESADAIDNAISQGTIEVTTGTGRKATTSTHRLTKDEMNYLLAVAVGNISPIVKEDKK